MTGKYDAFTDLLRPLDAGSLEVSFAELEELLGSPLPKSAWNHQAWWANEAHGSHSHARSWQDAGWETRRVDLTSKKVGFRRRRLQSNADPVNAAVTQRDLSTDLWEKASRLSGIENREALIEAALTALIRREAAKQLIQEGLTDTAGNIEFLGPRH